MVSRLTGAVVRAALVMILVAMPALLFPQSSADAKQVVALVALFVGALTLVEYTASYPSLLEFRHAPPYNRLRYMMLLITVFLLVLMRSDTEQTSTAALVVETLAIKLAELTDTSYSPVRLLLSGASDLDLGEQATLRGAAAISFLVSGGIVLFFYLLLRLGAWPARGMSFNLWINLPSFDPAAGSDIAERLAQDARINVLLAMIVAISLPVVASFALDGLVTWMFEDPQVLIWSMAIWSFAPASLLMRGIALARVAAMIRIQRRGIAGASARPLAAA